MTRSILTLLSTLALTACGGGSYQGDWDSGDGNPWDSADTDTSDDSGGGPTLVPSWWTVGGQLALVDGDVDTDTTPSLKLTYWAEEEEGLGDPIACPTDLEIQQVATLTETPDESIPLQGWWQIELVPPEAPPCNWSLGDGAPMSFHLGIGTLDPQLHPAMQANDLDPSELSLHAAYIQLEDGDTVYVYGVAGTDEQFEGTADASSESPLPDGTYRVEALHLLPL